MTEANFEYRDQLFYPTPASQGPWGPNSLGGRSVVSLLAFTLEQAVGSDEYLPARLTVDMYRLPDFSPIDIQLKVIRDGYRIKVMDAEFVANGETMARASCQFLRRTENTTIPVWGPSSWDAPAPEDVPTAGEQMGWERRIFEGGMNQFGKKRLWLSDRREVVSGNPLTPFLRAALIADFANPLSNSGDGGLAYINSDVTLYLHRLPVDEWIGMEVVNHAATDGVAIGECWMYDRVGRIGSSSVTGLAQKRVAQPAIRRD